VPEAKAGPASAPPFPLPRRHFPHLRLQLLTLLANVWELVQLSGQGDPPGMPAEAWEVLCRWVFDYPACDMYHAQFHRLLIVALTSEQEVAIRVAFGGLALFRRLRRVFGERSPRRALRGFATSLVGEVLLMLDHVGEGSCLRSQVESLDKDEFWRDLRREVRGQRAKESQWGMGLRVEGGDGEALGPEHADTVSEARPTGNGRELGAIDADPEVVPMDVCSVDDDRA
jgi:hypothetical protein